MYYGYARVSTIGQSDASIENQIKYLCIQAQSLQEEFESYSEKVSGKDSSRPQLQTLLSDLKHGDILGVYDNSRLGRETSENLFIAKQIINAGARLHVNGRFIDLSNPNDEMLLTIESAVSTYQRKNQNLKSRVGIDTKKESGKWIFTSRLLGWDVRFQGGFPYITINEEEAKIIRYIFEEYAKHRSTNQITKDLNNMGFRTRENTLFTTASIRRYILKPIYMGWYEIQGNKGRYQTPVVRRENLVKSEYYPPIISEDLWWKVNDSYLGVKRTHSRQFEYRWSAYELSSVLKCGYCEASFVHSYHKQNSGKTNSNYVGRHHKKGCGQTVFTLRAEVYEDLMRFLFYSSHMWSNEIGEYKANKTGHILKRKEEIEERIHNINKLINTEDKKIENLYSAIEKGLDADSTIKRIQSIEENKKNLKKSKSDLIASSAESAMELEHALSDISDDLLQRFYHGTPQERRDIYTSLLTAYIYNNKLIIRFVFDVSYIIQLHKNKGRRIQHQFEIQILRHGRRFSKVVYNTINGTYDSSDKLIVDRLDSIMNDIGGHYGRANQIND